MDRITMSIQGMSCDHCVRGVRQALEELDGVSVEQVAIGEATVQYDGAKVSPDRIADAIADEGYQVVATR